MQKKRDIAGYLLLISRENFMLSKVEHEQTLLPQTLTFNTFHNRRSIFHSVDSAKYHTQTEHTSILLALTHG